MDYLEEAFSDGQSSVMSDFSDVGLYPLSASGMPESFSSISATFIMNQHGNPQVHQNIFFELPQNIPEDVKQEIKELASELDSIERSMPECAERHARKLLAYFTIFEKIPSAVVDTLFPVNRMSPTKAVNGFNGNFSIGSLPINRTQNNSGSVSPLQSNIRTPTLASDVQLLLDQLEYRLGVEKLDGRKARDALTEMKTVVRTRTGFHIAKKQAQILLQLIRPIDFELTLRLINEMLDSIPLIQGRNIVLLVGGTGSGKSTLLQFLGGSNLIPHPTEVGYLVVEEKSIINDQLREVKMSSSTTSETSKLTPIVINLRDLDSRWSKSKKLQTVIICDSAGIGDNRGIEVDLANGIAMIKCIKECKSVSIIFVVKEVGNKWEQLKSQAQSLISMISTAYFHDCMRNFTYVFTGKSQHERETIATRLRELQEMKANENDLTFLDLIDDMADKLENNIDTSYVWTLGNYGNADRVELLKVLSAHPPIVEPATVFQPYTSATSNEILRDYMKSMNQHIVAAMRRHEYSLVRYRLDQFQQVMKVFHDDIISDQYQLCLEQLKSDAEESYQVFVTDLKRKFSASNTLTKDDIECYQMVVKQMRCIEGIFSSLPNILSFDALAAIEVQAAEILNRINQLCKDEISLQQFDLNKLQLIEKEFPDLHRNFYKEAKEVVRTILNDKIAKCDSLLNMKHLTPSTLAQADQLMQEFVSIKLQLSDHLGNTFDEIESNLCQIALESVQEVVKDCELILNSISMEDKNNIRKLQECQQLLLTASKLHSSSLFEQKEVQDIHQRFMRSLKAFVNELSANVINHLNSKQPNLFKAARKPFEQMRELQLNIPGLSSETSDAYHNACLKLLAQLYLHVSEVTNQLEKLRKREYVEDGFSKLQTALEQLKDASWTSKYLGTDYSEMVGGIEKELIRHVEGIEREMKKISLTLENSSHMETAKHNLEHISNLSDISTKRDEMMKIINAIEDTYIQSVTSTLQSIELFINNQSISQLTVRKELDDLRRIQEHYISLSAGVQHLALYQCTSLANLEEQINEAREAIKMIQKKKQEHTESQSFLKFEELELERGAYENRIQVLKEVRVQYDRIQESNVLTAEQRSYLDRHNFSSIEEVENRLQNAKSELEVATTYRSEKIFSTIDLDHLSVALKYLDAVYLTAAVRDMHSRIRTKIDDILNQYVQFIITSISRCYNLIVNPSTVSPDVNEDVGIYKKSLAVTIQSRLDEYETVRKDNSTHYHSAIKDAFRKLGAFLVRLENRITQENSQRSIEMNRLYQRYNHIGLEKRLLIYEALSYFDGKSLSLHTEYANKLSELLGAVERRFSASLIEKNFENALLIIEQLAIDNREDSQFHLGQCKEQLRNMVTSWCRLLQERALTLDHLTYESALQLNENISNLKNLVSLLGVFMDASLKAQIHTTINFAERHINSILASACQNIDGLLVHTNFVQAESELGALARIHAILDTNEQDKITSDEMRKKLQQLKMDLQEKISSMITDVRNSSIYDYHENSPYAPKQMLNNVRVMSATNSFSVDELRKIYEQKFLEALKEIKEERNPFTRDQKLKQCEIVLRWYPDDLAESLKLARNYMETSLKQSIVDKTNAISAAVSNNNPILVKKMWEDYKEEAAADELLYKLTTIVTNHIIVLKTQIEQNLNSENASFTAVQQNFKNLLAYKSYLGDIVHETKSESDIIEKLMASTYISSISELLHLFKKNISNTAVSSNLIVKQFKLFCSFLNIQQDEQCQCDSLKISNFAEFANSVHNTISNFFNMQHDKYDSALANLVVDSIKQCLQLLSDFETLAQLVRSYSKSLERVSAYQEGGRRLSLSVDENTRTEQYYVQKLYMVTTESENEVLSADINNAEMLRDAQRKKAVFEGLGMRLSYFVNVQELQKWWNDPARPTSIIVKRVFDETKQKLSFAEKKAKESIALLGNNVNLRLYDDFNSGYETLAAFNDAVKVDWRWIGLDVGQILTSLNTEILGKVKAITDSIEKAIHNRTVDKIAENLLKLKLLSDNLPRFASQINSKLEESLEHYKDYYGTAALKTLAHALIVTKHPTARALAAEHPLFYGWQHELFIARTGQFTIDHVLSGLEGTDLNTSKLKKKFNEYLEKFQTYVTMQVTGGSSGYGQLVANLKTTIAQQSNAEGRVYGLNRPTEIAGLKYTPLNGSLVSAVACWLGVDTDEIIKKVITKLKRNPEWRSLVAPTSIKQYCADLAAGRADPQADLLAKVLSHQIVILSWNGKIHSKTETQEENAPPIFVSYNTRTSLYDGYLYSPGLCHRIMGIALTASEILANLQTYREKASNEWLDQNTYYILPDILAYVAAIYSLTKSEKSMDLQSTTSNWSTKLWQPHPAQIIGIFRLFGVGDSFQKLTNNLVQIGTGEGKSVTLALTAAICALLGARVSVACYSEKLCARDKQMFVELFDILGVTDRIRYGTFEQLCESVINENGFVRDRVKDLILNSDKSQEEKKDTYSTGEKKEQERAKILLIDEVDVFFSNNFYGELYCPAACIKLPNVSTLAKAVWAAKNPKSTVSMADGDRAIADAVTALKADLSGWEFLVDSAVQKMLQDIKQFDQPNYIVNTALGIGYTVQDTVKYDVLYDYRTLFAYFHENERGNISQEVLDQFISLDVKCGFFSYAEIPKQFQYIMGVTGTLSTLSEPEKSIVTNVYQIHKETYMPSIYGSSNLAFAKNSDILIVPAVEHYHKIVAKIEQVMKGDKRAVFVFFENKEKLLEFESTQKHNLPANTEKLHEESDSKFVQTVLSRACIAGALTLFTRAFGRGIDFVCHDDTVIANGGVVCIQTFLSEEVSEEVQIKGRTARQGQNGSYCMVLAEEHLEKFLGVDYRQIIQKMRDDKVFYDRLDTPRKEFFKQQYLSRQGATRGFRRVHEYSQRLLASLDNDLDFVKKYLNEKNATEYVTSARTSRTLVLLDGTGSMSHLIRKTKEKITEMINKAKEILIEEKMDTDVFALQIGVYRNYNATVDALLQCSGWETDPVNLMQFLQGIKADYGLGNEAIEVALQHANNELERKVEVSQVILIGDAPPNSEQEVVDKRAKYSYQDWDKSTKYSNATFWKTELNKLVNAKIPVHAFYVDNYAKSAFETIVEIAKSGNPLSRCEYLPVNDEKGATVLTHLITEEILRNVGGAQHGDRLVDIYRTKSYR
jgi:energy-coupling factor transporter ATP-binding protein EcfA2